MDGLSLSTPYRRHTPAAASKGNLALVSGSRRMRGWSWRNNQFKRPFANWLQSGDGIFHIPGKPGSGTSTSMKLSGDRYEVVRPLLEKWSGKKQLVFARLFSSKAGTNRTEKTLEGLIQGTLQVLTTVTSLPRTPFRNAELNWPTVFGSDLTPSSS
jgi:hypothetical protein